MGERHKPSMPPIRLPSITLRGPSKRRKSSIAANRLVAWWAATLSLATAMWKSCKAAALLRPQCPQDIRTEKHKSLTPLICLGVLGWEFALRLTRKPKSRRAADLLGPWCSQGLLTEKHKSLMPLLRWIALGRLTTLQEPMAKRKSCKAAELLWSW